MHTDVTHEWESVSTSPGPGDQRKKYTIYFAVWLCEPAWKMMFNVSDWNWWDCKLMFTYCDTRDQEMKGFTTFAQSVDHPLCFDCLKIPIGAVLFRRYTRTQSPWMTAWSPTCLRSGILIPKDDSDDADDDDDQSDRREASPTGGQDAAVPPAPHWPGGGSQVEVFIFSKKMGKNTVL